MPLKVADHRSPAVAGLFYPAHRDVLSRDIDSYLDNVSPQALKGDLAALLVPHAGYSYSGSVAAEAFRQLRAEWDQVVLLGPSHRAAVKGAAVWAKGSFETPLGTVAVDEDLVREFLASSPYFQDLRLPHEGEHSLEVQLPFLQKTLGSFRIVPILMNTDQLEVCREIGGALAKVLARSKALLVLSSDLSHYPDQVTARRTDLTSLLALQRLDSEFLKLVSEILLNRDERELHCTACGESALVAGLVALRELGVNVAQLLRYANSADVPEGDPARVVGYAAVAFTRQPLGSPADVPFDSRATLELLSAARLSILDALHHKALESIPLSDSPVLNLPINVFVTLWLDGQLQGCIGSVEPRETLLEAVRRLARDSAFEDPRGRPLGRAELARLKIEISILSPFQNVSGPADISMGRHGVMLTQGSRRGLFLPEVWKHFESKEEFLDALCEQKMGLPRRTWEDPGMRFQVFTTQKLAD